MMPELTPQRLKLLKQIVPTIRRVAILWRPGTLSQDGFGQMLNETQATARSLDVQIQIVEAEKAGSEIDNFRHRRSTRLLTWRVAMNRDADHVAVVDHLARRCGAVGRLPRGKRPSGDWEVVQGRDCGAEGLAPDSVTGRATVGSRVLSPDDVIARVDLAVAIEIRAAK